MEPSRGVEIKVGIFVVIAVALTVGFIIALGGDKAIFHSNMYLYMVSDESQGLSLGSIVQVAGIPAGNVVAVDFDNTTNNVKIRMKIDKRFESRITKGSEAAIHTQGALGDKYVDIVPGPKNAEPMHDGDTIEAEPPTDLLSTLGKSGTRVEKAFDILDNVDKLVRGLNEKGFAQNLSETAKNLKGSSQALEDVLSSVRGPDPKTNKLKKSLDHLANIMEKIDKGEGTIGGLINDPTVHQDIKTLLGGAKRSKVLKYLIHQAVQGGEEAEKEGANPK